MVDDLRSRFDRHELLLFRDQELTAADQVRFTSAFGPVIDAVGNGMHVAYVSNRRPDGVVEADGELPRGAVALHPRLSVSALCSVRAPFADGSAAGVTHGHASGAPPATGSRAEPRS